MTEKERKAKNNEYKREWYRNHPGKNREYQVRHWTKKIKKMELEQKEAKEEQRKAIGYGIES